MMPTLATSGSPRPASSQAGFTLLGVILLIAVMNIFLGVAVARWSFVNQRDREVELIWRGEQYSRGLRCYLQATGVPPTELEDLLEEHCMRQLYADPMSSTGEWKILRAADLGEEGLAMVAGMIGSEGEGADAESEIDVDDEGEEGETGMRRSSLADRLRQRRSGSTSTSEQGDEETSSRFGSRFSSRFSSDSRASAESSGSGLGSSLSGEAEAPESASTEGSQSGVAGRQSLRERAEGRLRDRLAARDLTGGRGRKSLSDADLMSAILGVSTSGSGDAIRTYMEKTRYEDWFFALAGAGQQDNGSGETGIPGIPPSDAGGLPPTGIEGTGRQDESGQRQSRFRRPSLRRGG